MRSIASGILVVCAAIWTISTSGAVEFTPEANCSKVAPDPAGLPADVCRSSKADGSRICDHEATGCTWAVGPDEHWHDAFATEHLPEGWVSCEKPGVEQILHMRDGSRRFFSDACIVEVRHSPPPIAMAQSREPVPITRGDLDEALKQLRINLNDDIRKQVDKRIAELFPPTAPRVRPPAGDGPTVPISHIPHHHHHYYYPWCPPPWWDPWWDPWW
jgi:hypothetical protein